MQVTPGCSPQCPDFIEAHRLEDNVASDSSTLQSFFNQVQYIQHRDPSITIPRCWAPLEKVMSRNLSHGTIQFFLISYKLVIPTLVFKHISCLFSFRKVIVTPTIQKIPRVINIQHFLSPTICICPFYIVLLFHWKKHVSS